MRCERKECQLFDFSRWDHLPPYSRQDAIRDTSSRLGLPVEAIRVMVDRLQESTGWELSKVLAIMTAAPTFGVGYADLEKFVLQFGRYDH